MRSTFMGLEASKRGIFTQQTALYTTGHNISNANTEGYTRQRVNMSPTQGYPGIGLNAPMTPGFIGTGVQSDSVQRMRDQFLDRQYRQETNKLGYWESRSNAISRMEDILSEPTEYGLNEAFNQFWSAMQDVSTNPEDNAARKVVIQRAEHLADTFNYLDTQLSQVQKNLGNEIDVTTTQINTLLRQISWINAQVKAIEPNGYIPNDLYDARDKLLDELNEYIPVSLENEPSGGNAVEIAEGSITVIFNGVKLVEGNKYASITSFSSIEATGYKKVTGNNDTQPFAGLAISSLGEPPNSDDQEYIFTQSEFEPSKGKLISLINSYGYKVVDDKSDLDNPEAIKDLTTNGYYVDMIGNLKKLAKTFTDIFNTVHAQGHPLPPKTNNDLPEEFFIVENGKVLVNEKFNLDPSLLAASSNPGEEGNGAWANILANLQFTGLDGETSIRVNNTTINIDSLNPLPDLEGATFQTFYEGIIGQMAVDGQEATRTLYNTETIRLSVENNRASMSSVSLDEEMTNMITFQQAYNANARMITVIDEMLDKIINGLGRVGL